MMNELVASVLTGQHLGVYQFHERIGIGGMGEVYRARDIRLARDVAVKILPREFAAEVDRLARFEREARILASLNHPNIATIHGLEDSDGVLALVMELVEGATLAGRLTRGAMPLSEALGVARQIAEALDAAHEKGIVHRDLKPANVMVTSAGLVKVLDFGLAKHVGDVGAAAPSPEVQTMTASPTREGFIVGTAAYMSPEQARGNAVDKRTDVWAFGCVLYEMLTGRATFARETISDTIATILEHEPDWEAVPSAAPTEVHRLLRRCLAKVPAHRLRDIGDARIELDELLAAGPAFSSPLAEEKGAPRPWLWAGTGVLGGGLIVAAVALSTSSPVLPIEPPAQFTLSFEGQMGDVAATTVPVPSPDGRSFAFVGTNEDGVTSLWTRALDSAETRPVPGTEGAQATFWSPDGRWIGFYADGRLKKVRASGGPPQTIASLPGLQDAAWGRGGDIIFRPSNREPLLRISDDGGEPNPLTRLNVALAENSHRGPTFLPDGRRFLFTSRCAVPENNTLYVGSLDSSEVRRVMPIQSKAVYIPSRHNGPGVLLYYRDGNLEARTFDEASATVLGEPQPVAASVAYNAAGIQALFEVSADGRLIVSRPAGAGATQLTWFERSGEQTGTVGGPGIFYQPRISPRGDLVAFNRPDTQSGNRDVWTVDVARGIAARLTIHPANDWHAVWSPDGKRMAFASDRSGQRETTLYFKQSIDAGGEELPLLDLEGGPTDWSRDGQWIAYGSTNLEIVAASGDRKPFSFLVRPFRQGGSRFSPDGRWIAYVSDETGRFEVFVRPFSGGSAESDSRVQVSEAGGDFPVWRSDGRELYYMSGDFTIYAVSTTDLRTNGTVGRPERLFRACPGSVTVNRPLHGAWWSHSFDTLDGKRFLVNCAAQPPGQFNVLMNWSPSAVR